MLLHLRPRRPVKRLTPFPRWPSDTGLDTSTVRTAKRHFGFKWNTDAMTFGIITIPTRSRFNIGFAPVSFSTTASFVDLTWRINYYLSTFSSGIVVLWPSFNGFEACSVLPYLYSYTKRARELLKSACLVKELSREEAFYCRGLVHTTVLPVEGVI